MSKDFSRTLLIFAAVAVAVGMCSLPVFTKASNCGGNSAALNLVTTYVNMTVIETMDTPKPAFNVLTATPDQRRQIAQSGYSHWISQAHFLVSTKPFVPRSDEPRRVVIVCDTPYSNVPRRRFFESPRTHAAGFSDGTTGLISPKEFASLDRSTFIAIDDLFPEAKHADGKPDPASHPASRSQQ